MIRNAAHAKRMEEFARTKNREHARANAEIGAIAKLIEHHEAALAQELGPDARQFHEERLLNTFRKYYRTVERRRTR